jgi:hypothetical protein
VLLVLRDWLLPEPQDQDITNLEEVLVWLDDALLKGSIDLDDWSPRGYPSDLSSTKVALSRGLSADSVVQTLFDAVRVYLALFRRVDGLTDLIPRFLELEDSWELSKSSVPGGAIIEQEEAE